MKSETWSGRSPGSTDASRSWRTQLRDESAQTRECVDLVAHETRRHFDVVAEGMEDRFKVLADGISANSEAPPIQPPVSSAPHPCVTATSSSPTSRPSVLRCSVPSSCVSTGGFSSIVPEFSAFLAAAFLVKPAIFHRFGLYRRYWRYATVRDLSAVVFACGATAVAMSLFIGIAVPLGLIQEFSRAVLVSRHPSDLAGRRRHPDVGSPCPRAAGRAAYRGLDTPSSRRGFAQVRSLRRRSGKSMRGVEPTAHPDIQRVTEELAPAGDVRDAAKALEQAAEEGDRLQVEATLCDWIPTFTPWLTGLPSGVGRNPDQS